MIDIVTYVFPNIQLVLAPALAKYLKSALDVKTLT